MNPRPAHHESTIISCRLVVEATNHTLIPDKEKGKHNDPSSCTTTHYSHCLLSLLSAEMGRKAMERGKVHGP